MKSKILRRAERALAAFVATVAILLGFAAFQLPAEAASYLVDNVKMSVSGTPGAGTITLGSAVAGSMSGSAASIPNGSQVSYYISDGGSNWEIGHGTYNTTGPTLTRGAIWSSGTSNAAISLDSSALVSLTVLAEDLSPSLGSGFVNKIRNGTMDVWQRGTSALTTSTTGAYTADGWIVKETGGASTVSRGSRIGAYNLFTLSITGASGNTDNQIIQRIESYVAAPVGGKTVTLQFGFYQTTGSSVTPTVSTGYASSVDNFATVSSDLGSTGLTSCATATYCTEAYTFSASANATNGYQITIDCGALAASQTCQVTAVDLRATPGIATGINSTPAAPELRPISIETGISQEYYEPVSTGSASLGLTCYLAGTTIARFGLEFKVRKRIPPALTVNVSSLNVNTSSGNTVPSSGVISGAGGSVTQDGVSIDLDTTGSFGTLGDACSVGIPVGAMSFSAEL